MSLPNIEQSVAEIASSNLGLTQNLGVNPNEIYTSNYLPNYLIGGNTVTANNFISVVIIPGSGDNNRVDNDTVITLFAKDDSFNLKMQSTYSNPLSGGSSASASLGASYKTVTQTVNGARSALTGLALFNKMAYLPTWSGIEPLSFSIPCTLLATSDPHLQVELPIQTLFSYCTPMNIQSATSNQSSWQVGIPGPIISTSSLSQLASSANTSWTSAGSNATIAGAQNLINSASGFDFSSLVVGSDTIYVQVGSAALIGPVVITSVTINTPNAQSSYSGPLVDSTIKNNQYIPYCDLTISFTTYFPPIWNGGNDFDSVTLLPNSSLTASENQVSNIFSSFGF
jgi:hypothetical protein